MSLGLEMFRLNLKTLPPTILTGICGFLKFQIAETLFLPTGNSTTTFAPLTTIPLFFSNQLLVVIFSMHDPLDLKKDQVELNTTTVKLSPITSTVSTLTKSRLQTFSSTY